MSEVFLCGKKSNNNKNPEIIYYNDLEPYTFLLAFSIVYFNNS